MSFLGDILFYGRYPGTGYLIGFVRIDAEQKKVKEQRLCLEFMPEKEPNVNARAASIVSKPAPVRVADYVFWKNQGYDNSWFPDQVQGTWKRSETRVLNLRNGSLLSLDKIPRAVLREHQEQLSEFIN